jgi:hypothetical protein
MSCKSKPKLGGRIPRKFKRATPLSVEQLEPRLVMTAVEWFDLSGWDFAAVSGSGQNFSNVAAHLDIGVTMDSGSFDECDADCAAFSDGSLDLKQREAVGALKFSADSRQRFVVELQVLDTAEAVGVFTAAVDLFDMQTSGATVYHDDQASYAFNGETLQGIVIRGAGNGLDPTSGAANVRVVTGPASDLIIEYEGMGNELKFGDFRVGRVTAPPPVVDWFEFSTHVGSKFLDVADSIAEVNTEVTIDSGSFADCSTSVACVDGGEFFTLSQNTNVGALRFSSNSLHQYVVEMQIVGSDERIGVFTETSETNDQGEVVSSRVDVSLQSSGADVTSWVADYLNGDRIAIGLAVQGGGEGFDPVTGAGDLIVVTEPATDLILEYEGLANQKYGTFRIGRVDRAVITRSSIALAEAFAEQGLAVDPPGNRYFGASTKSITRFDTHWSNPETDAMIRDNGSPYPLLTDIQTGTPTTIAVPEVTHFGAIDYHAGYIWAGLLEQSGPHAAIAKIDADTFELVQVWDLLEEAERLSLPESTFRSTDPVNYDGTHLWVGTGRGIYRVTVNGPNGAQVFSEVVALNPHPNTVGEPDDESNWPFYSQGIRAVGDRIYAIIPRFGGYPFPHSPITGLYEFEIPHNLDGFINAPNLPKRVWHIPQSNGHHLEGFDFVPGREDEIFLAYSNGKTLKRLRLTEFAFADTQVPFGRVFTPTDPPFAPIALGSETLPHFVPFEHDDGLGTAFMPTASEPSRGSASPQTELLSSTSKRAENEMFADDESLLEMLAAQSLAAESLQDAPSARIDRVLRFYRSRS